MSQYQASAEAAAKEYERRRRAALAAATAAETAAGAVQIAAAEKQAEDARRAAEETRLDAVDTAAVEEQLALLDAREALASAGLAPSGYAKTRTAGIREGARRAGTAATSAYTAEANRLEEALSRTTSDITAKQSAAVRAHSEKAEKEIAANREKLLAAAYAAESREKAAEIAAQQKREEAERKAAEKAREAAMKAEEERKRKLEEAKADEAKLYETRRKEAIRQLYTMGLISPILYTAGLEYGWTTDDVHRLHRVIRQAASYADDGNQRGAVEYVRDLDLSPEQMSVVFAEAGVDDDYIRQYGMK